MAKATTTQILTTIKEWVLGKLADVWTLIPSQASSSNQLADKAFVNSSIATATATFRGTYNLVSDLSLTTSATQQQIAAALATKMTALSITPDTNDYTFVQVPTDDATPTEIERIDRYKYDGSAWEFEYALNNSGFTAEQWAAINSGVTSGDMTKLRALPTSAELTTLLNGKQDVIQDLADIRSGASAGATAVQPATLNSALSNTVAESGVFDLSAYNNGTKYADLNAALTALNALPDDYKKGGMSFKYVRSSDNKYVQYRYMGTATTGNPNPFLNTDNWSFCGDNVLTECPEYMAVYLDADRRIIKAVKNDGTEYFVVGVEAETIKVFNGAEVHGDINTDAAEITMIDSPEFMDVYLTQDNKILYGIQKDGNFYFGCGVPKQIIDYVESRISNLSLNEYEDIVAFLNGLESGEKTLSQLLAEKADAETVIAALAAKVDKVEGKSLIDSDVADRVHYVENPEFIKAELDSEGHIIKATKNDGTEYFAVGVETEKFKVKNGVEINGNIDTNGVEITMIENPEFMDVYLDSNKKILFGLQNNGNFYFGCGVPKQIIDYIESKLAELSLDEYEDIVTFLGNLIEGNTLADLLNGKVDKEEGKDIVTTQYVQDIECPEYMNVEIDSENKILGGRDSDGTKFENVGFKTPNISIDGFNIEATDDPEDRMDMGLDLDKKIVHYRDKDGVLHENVGVETNRLVLTKQGMDEFQQELKNSGFKPALNSVKFNLPKYGTVNIKQETFYLTKGDYTDKDDIEVRQELPDTNANAALKLTLAHYYIKNTDTRLDFYAATKVTKIEDRYYVTDSLVDGQVVPESIEVTQIIDKPDVKTWPVDKKTEHYCLVDINFGHYLTKNNVAIGVKYQGSSTLESRKRNFRFTFYKNATYAKKDKIKIGELLRLSGFNLKANWSDNSRIKEAILYRVIVSIWNNRPITDRYPWDKEHGYYTGATGTINGFPITVNIGGGFYGIYIFGLKKDEKNYLLDGDDDSSGIFVSCDGYGAPQAWTITDASVWSDEMEAVTPMSQETADALNTLFDFINERLYKGSDNNYYVVSELTNVDGAMYVTSTLEDGQVVPTSISAILEKFNKENVPNRMDVQGFVDYFICLQTFQMWDNGYRNMILYSGRDKKKFYPYMYDLDLSLKKPYNEDFFFMTASTPSTGGNDWLLWDKMVDVYWDEIVNRYCELRKTVLNIDFIRNTYHDIADNISDGEYQKENLKWTSSTDKIQFEASLALLERRFDWLDNTYFKV